MAQSLEKRMTDIYIFAHLPDDALEGRMGGLEAKVEQIGTALSAKMDLILARLPSP